ncbi:MULTISPECIES: acetyl-CoA carboxylase biotin carboxyl carrier protein [unclassified Aureispira]|uniref:acetyl-CoA carboxylase biotin carboxyl carrier protein n=1 Tax=unclassified Aureispira TaxID=2649989 RepID=UPI000697E202|nr:MULTISPECIES: acetyl-CoA carboxylase biotin carboxyl carrier protein [unclassified Aureispira]WMX13973.1 acetyl-CoA carboxylase biotin carboxyl carrier protein [Aureispira sp. CCB-E]
MEFEKIKELIKLIQKSKISEFKYEDEASKISIRTKNYSAQKEVIVQPSVMPGMQVPSVAATPVAPAANNDNAATPAATKESAPAAEESNNYIEIKSPMVGTFYRSASPEKPAFVKVGDSIGGDDTVCLIEAMKLFNEVKAEVEGRIVKVMVEDASPVEYGQVLFLVEPA